MSTKSPNILISGLGIAGTVFASTLLRAYPSATITIVERDARMRLTGASVDIRSSAVDIIKWMDCETAIRNKTTKEQGVQFLSRAGKTFATFKATGDEQVQSMTSEYEIFRGDLARIFWEPIRDKVSVLFDESVQSYTQHPSHVSVTLTHSKETKDYDLLVAADGLGSRIRGLMLDAAPATHIHDEGVYASFFVVDTDLLDGSNLAKWYNTTRGRAIFLRPDPDPRGRTRAHLINAKWPSDVKGRDSINAALKRGTEPYMQLMEHEFADAGWLAPKVLRAMRATDDFYCSKFAQVRCPRVRDGRVVLVGDAGYACPGIGTSLAIMGAYVLSGELLRHDFDVTAATKAYQDLMLPFVKRQQGTIGDYAMQVMNPQSAWGLWLRNMVLWAVNASGIDQAAIWAAGKLGLGEGKLDMPAYPWPEVEK